MLEMNFARLLHHTEDLASTNKAHEIRFESYLDTLKTFFSELVESSDRPTEDYVRHYESRLKQLESARELALSASIAEKQALLIKPTSPLVPRPVTDDSLVITTVTQDAAVKSRSQPTLQIKGVLEQSPNILRIEHKRIDAINRDLLLGKIKHIPQDSDDLHVSTTKPPQERSHLIHNEELRREHLASEMLHMARHLKDQSSAIGERLQADRQLVEASVDQADRNAGDMSVVLNQLTEELGSRCGRIVWIALLVAVVVFFQMIAFMKLFRKRLHPVYTTNRSEL